MCFENSSVGRSKLGCVLYWRFGIAIWNRRLDIQVFLQWAIVGGVVVETYFKGIQLLKRIKWVVHFMIALFWRYWTIKRHQILSDREIFEDDIAIFGIVYKVFTCLQSEIFDRSNMSPQIYFNKNTFFFIIMMISVVLCKINEEINYVSIFHIHVVQIWLRNRQAKLSWNRIQNS